MMDLELITQKIITLLEGRVDQKPNYIKPSHLISDLGADSLNLAELMIDIESEFDVYLVDGTDIVVEASDGDVRVNDLIMLVVYHMGGGELIKANYSKEELLTHSMEQIRQFALGEPGPKENFEAEIDKVFKTGSVVQE